MQEEFRPVKGYEEVYEVSNLGRVKSLGNNKARREKILKPSLVGGGYPRVVLSKHKAQKPYYVHTLVAIAFLNHKPNGHEIVVDHIDNIKTNNKSNNLQLLTQRENLSKNPRREGKQKSTYIGVNLSVSTGNWFASIYYKGKRKSLGSFKTEEEAHKTYQKELKRISNN